MIILRVACDNIYMFKDFELDFTYNRRINHPIAQGDLLFEGSHIKARKNLIIMGANASGKTTFGKLLRFILNFMHGANFEDAPNDVIAGIQCNRKKNAHFEIEFVIDRTAYLLKADFFNYQLCHEELRCCAIKNSYNISDLREALRSQPMDPKHSIDAKAIRKGLDSYLFTSVPTETTAFIRNHVWYSFRIAFQSNSVGYSVFPNIERINQILPCIDNSVKEVEALRGARDKTVTKSYLIKFCNGDLLTVPDGNLKGCGDRLSRGTFEAIDYISLLDELQSPKHSRLLYIDEQLPHLHAELEAYLIRQALLQNNGKHQLFFTTHNVEILDLNIPIQSFVFFHRRKDGWNEAIFPSTRLNKNDRPIHGYYENDYFGILPDYSVLDKFFESDDEGVQKHG